MARVSELLQAALSLMAVLTLAPWSAHAAAHAADDPPYKIEREALQFKLEGFEHTMRIDNPHGNVLVRRGALDKVEILAVKQIIGKKPVAPTLVTAIESKTSSIRVRYPKLRKPYYGRIDLVVYLPPETHLLLTTIDSTIEIKGGWLGVVEARTDSGKISVDGRNGLRLKSNSGRIVAAMFDGKRAGDSSIRTRGGSINLTVKKSASIMVHARTCGELESLSGSLEALRKGRCSNATATFSDGAHQADVRSRKGAVMVNAM